MRYVPAVKRNVGIAAAVLGVVGLVGLNLSLRAEPEPEFLPSAEALPSRGYSGAPGAADAREDPAPAGASRGTRPSAESGAAPSGAVEAAGRDEEAVEGASADPEVDGCDHPLMPSRAGQWRRYRWTLSTEEYAAEMRIRAARTIELPSGEREVVWLVQATSAEQGEQLAQTTLRTRCMPGGGSEDPWFGILERAIGHRLTRRTRRWRWPAELRRGVSFRGTATLDPARADARPAEGVRGEHMLTVTRNHLVNEQVEIEVPAGTFRAWRVAYEEQQAYGSHGETGTGTMWVAPDVGLVKSQAENSRGVVQTIELLELGGP